jgi:two-component system, NarL family, nitrate/nitrite response regulator NarL
LKIKIGIVGETRFYRECLVGRLSQDFDLPAFDLGTGDEATFDAAVRCDPDLILVDLPFPEACSFAEEALDRVEGTRPLAVCRSTSVEEQVRLAEAGFVGFVQATETADELVTRLRSAMRDETHGSPQFVGALLRTLRKRSSGPASSPPLEALSRRELEVAMLLQHRLSNKEIAAQLGIEFGTAKNHVHNVLTKLNVGTRWEIPHLALRVGPRRASTSERGSRRLGDYG